MREVRFIDFRAHDFQARSLSRALRVSDVVDDAEGVARHVVFRSGDGAQGSNAGVLISRRRIRARRRIREGAVLGERVD
jgi:hypothetical protein